MRPLLPEEAARLRRHARALGKLAVAQVALAVLRILALVASFVMVMVGLLQGIPALVVAGVALTAGALLGLRLLARALARNLRREVAFRRSIMDLEV